MFSGYVIHAIGFDASGCCFIAIFAFFSFDGHFYCRFRSCTCTCMLKNLLPQNELNRFFQLFIMMLPPMQHCLHLYACVRLFVCFYFAASHWMMIHLINNCNFLISCIHLICNSKHLYGVCRWNYIKPEQQPKKGHQTNRTANLKKRENKANRVKYTVWEPAKLLTNS